MKNYKNFKKAALGVSDVAVLTFTVFADDLTAFVLPLGGDGGYSAYIVHGKDVEIGAHYHLEKEIENFGWVRVYDDDGKPFDYNRENDESVMRIWRAGDYGIILQFC